VTSSGAARADEVWLKNGATITGKARYDGAEVVVAAGGGLIRVPASSVDRIDRGPLPDELFAARATTTDLADPMAARALARYARQLGMVETANRVERTADEIELETRVAAAAPGDVEALRGIAWWARARALGRSVDRYLLGKILVIAPRDTEARARLARIEADEREDERRRAEEKLQEERERAEAERAALEDALRRSQAEAERLRAEAEQERERRLAAERSQQESERAWRGSGREVVGPGIVIVNPRRRRGTAVIWPPLDPPPPPPPARRPQ